MRRTKLRTCDQCGSKLPKGQARFRNPITGELLCEGCKNGRPGRPLVHGSLTDTKQQHVDWDQAERDFPDTKHVEENSHSWLTPSGKVLKMPDDHNDLTASVGEAHGYGDPLQHVFDNGGVRVGHYKGGVTSQLYVEHHQPLSETHQSQILDAHHRIKPNSIQIQNGDRGHTTRLKNPTDHELRRALRGDNVIQKQFARDLCPGSHSAPKAIRQDNEGQCSHCGGWYGRRDDGGIRSHPVNRIDTMASTQFQHGYVKGRTYEPEEITHTNKPAPTDGDASWLRKAFGPDTKWAYDEVPRHKVRFGGGERLVDNDPEAEERYINSMVPHVHKLPPVLVDHNLAVNDGSHRMEAFDRAGLKTIPVMRPVSTKEAVLHTDAGPRLRMYRNSADGVTYCPKCFRAAKERDTGDDDFYDRFEPIHTGHPSIGEGSIEVCSNCGTTIVNSLPASERWGSKLLREAVMPPKLATTARYNDPIRMSALIVTAHDSGDGETIYHCGRGSERYWTYDGLKTLAETVGTVQKVLVNTGAGGVWRDAIIHSFGEQPLMKVTLRRNKLIKETHWTPEHRWLVRRRNDVTRSESRVVLTKDLKPDDRLSWLLPKSATARSVPSTFGIAHGIVFGDGTKTTEGTVVRLWGEKDAQLLRYFNDSATYPEKTPNGVEGIRVCNLPSNFKDEPSLDESVSYLYGWLAGYFAADGSVSKQGQVILESADRSALEFAQLVATRLGIGSYDIRTRTRQGYGDEPTDLHSIQFLGSSLPDHFLLIREHRENFDDQVVRGNPERFGWTVDKVEATDLVEEVFCPRVEGENFVLDGFVNTMNCPFCGSGQVIGRSDGTIECDFCDTHFTVQVQPEFAAMPQTINGQPQNNPSMPGDPTEAVDLDSAQPGMFGDPGAEEGEEAPEEGAPDQPAGGDSSTDSAPPWLQGQSSMHTGATPEHKELQAHLKEAHGFHHTAIHGGLDRLVRVHIAQHAENGGNCQSHSYEPIGVSPKESSLQEAVKIDGFYITAKGVALATDGYMKHLALAYADDHDAVLEEVRAENVRP